MQIPIKDGVILSYFAAFRRVSNDVTRRDFVKSVTRADIIKINRPARAG
jgi:hypothetical protein